MRLSWMKAALGIFLSLVFSVSLWGDTHGANAALPGTLNYVEGQASIGAETLNSKSIGSAELQKGQTLSTDDGKAEILLTPGVFLRLDAHSSVAMISPNLTDTQVEIRQGRAMIEVAQLYKENDIRILENSTITQLEKPGLYDFDAGQNQIRVFDGKALVRDGDRTVTLKGGREVSLDSGTAFKASKFGKKTYEASDLYRFSSLRSSYLAEANVDQASAYVAGFGYGPGWYGAGWYWDPWFSAYTFIPGDGIFYSPFGYGFYSPLWAYQAPYYSGRRLLREWELWVQIRTSDCASGVRGIRAYSRHAGRDRRLPWRLHGWLSWGIDGWFHGGSTGAPTAAVSEADGRIESGERTGAAAPVFFLRRARSWLQPPGRRKQPLA